MTLKKKNILATSSVCRSTYSKYTFLQHHHMVLRGYVPLSGDKKQIVYISLESIWCDGIYYTSSKMPDALLCWVICSVPLDDASLISYYHLSRRRRRQRSQSSRREALQTCLATCSLCPNWRTIHSFDIIVWGYVDTYYLLGLFDANILSRVKKKNPRTVRSDMVNTSNILHPMGKAGPSHDTYLVSRLWHIAYIPADQWPWRMSYTSDVELLEVHYKFAILRHDFDCYKAAYTGVWQGYRMVRLTPYEQIPCAFPRSGPEFLAVGVSFQDGVQQSISITSS